MRALGGALVALLVGATALADVSAPAAGDVRKLDARLAGALGAVGGAYAASAKRVRARLATDGVWYIATVAGGRRVIALRGFCASLTEGADKCPPMVKDGGDCIWYFEYDVARGTFNGFRTNGSA
jgi:hypothetical protein